MATTKAEKVARKDNSYIQQTVIEVKYTVLASVFSVLFEQVRLQQEVRDRWFGHYLTIVGAIATVATLCLKFFETSVRKNVLFVVIGAIFVFTGTLGVLFYILYLCQRRNYRDVYVRLSALQRIILTRWLSKAELKKINNGFTTRSRGADYYTLLIESSISSACFAVGFGFIISGLYLGTRLLFPLISASLAFIMCMLALSAVKSHIEKES